MKKGATMDETALLVAIETMRSNPPYQAAEVLRRQMGSGAMAGAPETSAEYRAVLLLVSVWEVIGVLLSDVKKKDKIFEVTPICHMYRELKDAIDILARRIPGFGAHFAELFEDYEAWLKKKKKHASYVSAACGGLHAKFG